MKSIYELRRFKNSNDPALIKALKLYSENIEAAYRTDTKEILYAIDNFNKVYEDYFLIVGLYLNNILIGFSEIAYFVKEKIVVIDYLIIDKLYRKNNTFYEFINKLEEFFYQENIVFDYVIGEVGCYFENAEPPETSKHLIRLLKMANFGVVKTKYYVPRLGINNYESEMIAVLMIFTPEKIKQIKKETYLTIVNTIYFKYYLRWYSLFLNESDKIEYKTLLDTLYKRITKDVEKKKIVEVNGYMISDFNIGTELKIRKFHRGIKLITVIIISIVCIFGVGFIGIFIQKKLGIDINSQSSIFIISLILISLISSLIFENKSNLFSNLLEKILDKL